MKARKQEVIDTLNKMIELSEPIYYDDINRFYRAKDGDNMLSVEKGMPKLGLASPFIRGDGGVLIFDYEDKKIGISTLSLLATISDCLCDDRLGFIIAEKTGLITGACWSGLTGSPGKDNKEI